MKRVAKTVTTDVPELHPPDLLARVRKAHKKFEKLNAEYVLAEDSGVFDEMRRDYIRNDLDVSEATLRELILVSGSRRALQDAVTAGYLSLTEGARLVKLCSSDREKLYSDITNRVPWKTIRRMYLHPETSPKPEPPEAYSRFVAGLESCCALVPFFDGKLTGDELLDLFPAMASAHEPITRVFAQAKVLDKKIKVDAERVVDALIQAID